MVWWIIIMDLLVGLEQFSHMLTTIQTETHKTQKS